MRSEAKLLTLDVVTKNLTVTLGSTLSESLKRRTQVSVRPQKRRCYEKLTLPPFPRPDILYEK
jgi:hypothetical protein